MKQGLLIPSVIVTFSIPETKNLSEGDPPEGDPKMAFQQFQADDITFMVDKIKVQAHILGGTKVGEFNVYCSCKGYS